MGCVSTNTPIVFTASISAINHSFRAIHYDLLNQSVPGRDRHLFIDLGDRHGRPQLDKKDQQDGAGH